MTRSEAAAYISPPYAARGADGSPVRRDAALETVHDALDPVLGEIAHHYFEAAPLGTLPKAIEFAIRAGQHAHAQLGYEEAAGHPERALQASRGTAVSARTRLLHPPPAGTRAARRPAGGRRAPGAASRRPPPAESPQQRGDVLRRGADTTTKPGALVRGGNFVGGFGGSKSAGPLQVNGFNEPWFSNGGFGFRCAR